MDNDELLYAHNAQHYMFQTPKTFLEEHNARNPEQEPVSIFAIRTLIIFKGDMLRVRLPSGLWRVPASSFDNRNDANITIDEFCYEALRRTGTTLSHPQIMELAFEEPLLEPRSESEAEREMLFMRVLITVSARPTWRDPFPARMQPMGEMEPPEGAVDAVLSAHMDEMLSRINGFSRDDLLARFPQPMDFLQMRMCFFRSYLTYWRSDKGDRPFYIIITQKPKYPNTGFHIFSTSRNVAERMIADPARRPVYNIDELYAFVGASFKESPEAKFATLLLSEDRPENVFAVDGRLKVNWIAADFVRRLENLIMSEIQERTLYRP